MFLLLVLANRMRGKSVSIHLFILDVPTGIVRCGNFDGFRLEDFISAKYGKRLIKLGHPVPSIYLVVQMIRKTPVSIL